MLPEGTWSDVVSGATYDGGARTLAKMLAEAPVAVLARVVE